MDKTTISRSQNRWTEEQRMVLHLLRTHFKFDSTTHAGIFNHIFNAHLRACGVNSGLSAGVLGSQYREHNREGRSHLWQNVLKHPTTDDERAGQDELISRIRNAAIAIGVLTTDAHNEDVKAEEAGENLGGDVQGIAQSQTLPISTKLDMVHSRSVTWNGAQLYIGDLEAALVDYDSAVYTQGGEVGRVTLADGQTADFMICDDLSCGICNTNADTMASQPQGLPFVHSSDTFRDQGITVFQPKPKVSEDHTGPSYWRRIQFLSLKGEVFCMAVVCGYKGCPVCMNLR